MKSFKSRLCWLKVTTPKAHLNPFFTRVYWVSGWSRTGGSSSSSPCGHLTMSYTSVGHHVDLSLGTPLNVSSIMSCGQTLIQTCGHIISSGLRYTYLPPIGPVHHCYLRGRPNPLGLIMHSSLAIGHCKPAPSIHMVHISKLIRNPKSKPHA